MDYEAAEASIPGSTGTLTLKIAVTAYLACAYLCPAGISFRQHDRHSERSSVEARSSCSGADSFPRRAFRGCVVALANGEAQGDGFHYLCADARDLRDTSLWPCRSRTTFRPNQRGGGRNRGLAINLTVPPAVILLETDAAAKDQRATANPSKPSAIVSGLNAGLKSPLLWGPILGIAVVLLSIHLPAVVAS